MTAKRQSAYLVYGGKKRKKAIKLEKNLKIIAYLGLCSVYDFFALK